MRQTLRQFRRAPGRIAASILALALAVGAVGVLAIPTVSSDSLRAAVAQDRLPDITLSTSPLSPADLASVTRIDGVLAGDREVDVGATLSNGDDVRIVGLRFASDALDRVQIRAGRPPVAPGEVVVSDGVALPGDALSVRNGLDTVELTVVGTGTTLRWAADRAVFGVVDDIIESFGLAGANRVVLTAAHDDAATLRSLGDRSRAVLSTRGVIMRAFPVYLPNDSTPIDADIRQVSTLIGLLGAVAGIVALVLLGSTTTTLISERTREVAVMRALGGRPRRLRRRLRRIATGITAIALVIGLPLGVVISNLIARMVLERFVGVTPDLAVSWPVIGASAAAALLGARLVAARAARRVTNVNLAETLRDREATPFGRRRTDRALARCGLGSMRTRLATRASLHRRARAASIVAQIAAGVGAVVVITTLTTSVNTYNTATLAPWTWQTRAIARDPGLPFPATIADADPRAETGVHVIAEIGGSEIDVNGVKPDTTVFHPRLPHGRWLAPQAHEVVLSDGFARRRGIAVGDTIDIELATGAAQYTVVGTADDANRSVYVDRADLAADLAQPGAANVLWSTSDTMAFELPGAVDVADATSIAYDEAKGRRAIVVIFATIATIVAGVAALAVASTLAVNLYERRHELASLQALGASKRRLRGVLLRELLPLGAVGVVVGVGAGWLGARGIIASFESSNEVDIGTVFAAGAIPAIVIGSMLAMVALSAAAVRSAVHRPVAVTLRGAV